MIIKIIAFLGISFCCFGKIYTLQDVELDFPKAESLKEEVIYSFIYNKNVSQVQDKLQDLKQKKVIDALDFYQYTNLLKSEKEYQEYYFVDKDLLILKKLFNAEGNKKEFLNIINDKYNDKYVYDYLIHKAFYKYEEYLDPFILNLKSSSQQFKLYIKFNYMKSNFIYLKSIMRKLNGNEKLLILDLIIKGKKDLRNEDKIKLIEKRNELNYDKFYSYELIKLYELEKLNFLMLAEINTILDQEKNYNLVKKIIDNKIKKIDIQDYYKYEKKVEDNKVLDLKYLIISKLYGQGYTFEKLLPEVEENDKFIDIHNYYKIIEYSKKREYRKAYLTLSTVSEQNKNKENFSKLKDQLDLLLDQKVVNEKSPYIDLSKKLNEEKILKNDDFKNENYLRELYSKSYVLSDFYDAYGQIENNNQIALIKCLNIYEQIISSLDDKTQLQLKAKIEALGFE